MKRRIGWIGAIAFVVLVVLFGASMWNATNQLLFPSWKGATRDLSVCPPELAEHWGEACGNLRVTRALKFEEVKVPSMNGYDLPGWLVRAEDNGGAKATGAIVLVHGGGCDRRELTRHIPLFLRQGLDVLTVDLGCHGEAPCPTPGLSYGHRESRDVVSTYLHLSRRYERVYAMGSSVGAASLLVALPEMPGLKGVIAENPMASFQTLIEDAPEAKSVPKPMMRLMIQLTLLRGRFDGLLSPEHSLRLAHGTPVLFIHSAHDRVASVERTRTLAEQYAGPKTTWFPEKGEHGRIWDVDKPEYERRVSEFLQTTARL